MKLPRRDFTFAIASAVILAPQRGYSQGSPSTFEAIVAALSDDQLESGRNYRERQEIELNRYETRALMVRRPPSQRPISQRATDLIIRFEVTSQAHYTNKLHRPIWPKGASGVTIGIGYDVGYVTKDWLRDDWGAYIASEQITKLSIACEKRGIGARDLASKLQEISIPWEKAYLQFMRVIVKRWVAEAEASLPNTRELSDDAMAGESHMT